MKKVKIFALSILSLLVVGGVSAMSGFDHSQLLETLGLASGAGLTVASLPIWFKLVN